MGAPTITDLPLPIAPKVITIILRRNRLSQACIWTHAAWNWTGTRRRATES